MTILKTFGTSIAEQSSTVGVSTYQLDGNLDGYRPFSGDFVTGDTPYYAVKSADETKYEFNKGTTTFTIGTPCTLVRDPWLSSNANAAVSWGTDDLPLIVYIPTPGEVMEGMVTGFLATSRNALIKFGQWWKKDEQAVGVHSLKLYDGASDIHLGIADTSLHTFTPALHRGQIFGLVTSNSVGDTAHDISITAGDAKDSTNALDIHLASTLVKQLDAAWAAGTNAGGRASAAAVAVGTTYHLFIAIISGVVDAFWDTSVTAANKPAGTTAFRRIWSTVTKRSAATIRQYVQHGDKCVWVDIDMGTSGNGDFPVLPGAASTLLQWSAGIGTIPDGIITRIVVQGYIVGSSGGYGVGLYDIETVTTPGNIGYQWTIQGSQQTGSMAILYTNTSRQIGVYYVGAITTIWFQIKEYEDRRGQDD